jgi:hypothetical protein
MDQAPNYKQAPNCEAPNYKQAPNCEAPNYKRLEFEV